MEGEKQILDQLASSPPLAIIGLFVRAQITMPLRLNAGTRLLVESGEPTLFLGWF
jgi:hypothetical protein